MSAEDILGTVFAALLNNLWQGAAMALLVWAALRLLPRMKITINAATRCAVWWAVLAAVVLLPLAPQSSKVLPATPAASFDAAPVPTPAAPVPAVPPQVYTSPAPTRIAEPLQVTAGAGLIAILAIWSALSLFRIAQIVRSYRY